MDDFASHLMMRLIRAALDRRGLGHLAEDAPRADGTRIPLQAKQALVDRVLRLAGPEVLLAIGDDVGLVSEEPLARVLLQAQDPFDALDRWRRLERFMHSRHRIEIRDRGPDSVILVHASSATTAPSEAEHYAVYGAISGLMRRAGAGSLTVDVDRREPALCRMSWTPVERGAMETDDAPLPRRLAALIEADPFRRWTADDVAQRLGLSLRTFQRRLTQAGSRFDAVLVSSRVSVAATHVSRADTPLAAAAFMSGFADQSHMTRAFARHLGLTPAELRNSLSG